MGYKTKTPARVPALQKLIFHAGHYIRDNHFVKVNKAFEW